MKTITNRLKRLFEKPPLDCDYVFEIFSDSFGFLDYEKHVSSLVKNQEHLDEDMGAWSESFSFSRGNEAPLATAEAILALINFTGKSGVRNAIRRASKFLIESQHDDGGWDDLSGRHPVNDATGCTIAALSEVEKRNIYAVPSKTMENGVKFLLSQQNNDGGWGTVKGEETKMHYTFFALMGLACCKDMLSDLMKKKTDRATQSGIKWIANNSSKNNDEGIGVSLEEAPSPVGTALAIMSLLETGSRKLIKPNWINFIKKNKKMGVGRIFLTHL